jgi:hypothetical protein
MFARSVYTPDTPGSPFQGIHSVIADAMPQDYLVASQENMLEYYRGEPTLKSEPLPGFEPFPADALKDQLNKALIAEKTFGVPHNKAVLLPPQKTHKYRPQQSNPSTTLSEDYVAAVRSKEGMVLLLGRLMQLRLGIARWIVTPHSARPVSAGDNLQILAPSRIIRIHVQKVRKGCQLCLQG